MWETSYKCLYFEKHVPLAIQTLQIVWVLEAIYFVPNQSIGSKPGRIAIFGMLYQVMNLILNKN